VVLYTIHPGFGPDFSINNENEMTEVILQNQNGEFLETLKIRHFERFIMCRGRLFEQTGEGEYTYIQRQYVEVD